MKLADARILVTGASSGIGRAIAVALADAGARVVASGRDETRLRETLALLEGGAARHERAVGDLSRLDEIALLVDEIEGRAGPLDGLVHAAGVNIFGPFAAAEPADLEDLVRTNLLSSMVLARELLPRMQARGGGSLLFVGSIFGSIGFPWFAAYSATKFALRGFTEALRREVQGSGVRVLYVAPRGTRTAMTQDYADMAEATKMPLDDPAVVAAKVVKALARDRAETFLGGAEPLFVRLNGVLPRMIDGAMKKERDRLAPFAARRARSADAPSDDSPRAGEAAGAPGNSRAAR